MKILHGAPASVFVRKVAVLLREKGIGFISEPVNPMEALSKEFREISPLGKIPVFRDGDYVLADSSVICAYLDKRYPLPSFYPADPELLGKALWFEEFADTALFAAIAPCYYQTVLVPLYRDREPDLAAIQMALDEKLPPVADYLEKQIVGKTYLVGDQLSIADVATVSIFLNMYLSGYPLSESKWPHLSCYLKHHFKRESFQSCVKDVEQELEKLKLIA